MATVAQATENALVAGASPLVLALAQKMLGKKEYIGYCQRFVQKMGGTTSGGSAIQAWQNAQNKVQGTQGIQLGDLVYLSANQSNKGFGHAGVYAGNNQFVSATDKGITQNDLNKWSQSTGQKILGYVPQGERQAQEAPSTQLIQSKQPQQMQRQPIIVPQFNPIPLPSSQPSQLSMPNPLSPAQQDTTTYGRITVPNI